MKTSIMLFLEQVNQQRTGLLDVSAPFFENPYRDLSRRTEARIRKSQIIYEEVIGSLK